MVRNGFSFLRTLPSLCILATLGSSFLGCLVTRERYVVGSYKVLDLTCTEITLLVREDHTFEQVAKSPSQETVNRIDGHWLVRDGRLEFKPFLSFTNNPRGQQSAGLVGRPERMPRGITIGPEIASCPDGVAHKVDYIKTD